MSSSAPPSEVSRGLYPIQTSPVRAKPLSARPITEISSPSFPKLHKHHHHHHHHHHPHLHRSAKEPQSANPSLQPSVSHTGEVSTSNDGSRDVSRQGSIWDEPKKQVTEAELQEERERGALRASELRNSVMELNAFSNNMTRRLDMTYYAVLEKLSALQSTIVSLKELATITRKVNEDFETESDEVIKDITSQLEGFGDFNKQEKRINSLKSRVAKGRERIRALGDRVGVVKDRVESWEKAEWEWQERTRKRLNILWTLMGIVALIFIGIKGLQYAQAPNTGLTDALNASGLSGKVPDLEALRNDTWRLERKIEKTFDGLKNPDLEEVVVEEDPRLRIFDEL